MSKIQGPYYCCPSQPRGLFNQLSLGLAPGPPQVNRGLRINAPPSVFGGGAVLPATLPVNRPPPAVVDGIGPGAPFPVNRPGLPVVGGVGVPAGPLPLDRPAPNVFGGVGVPTAPLPLDRPVPAVFGGVGAPVAPLPIGRPNVNTINVFSSPSGAPAYVPPPIPVNNGRLNPLNIAPDTALVSPGFVPGPARLNGLPGFNTINSAPFPVGDRVVGSGAVPVNGRFNQFLGNTGFAPGTGQCLNCQNFAPLPVGNTPFVPGTTQFNGRNPFNVAPFLGAAPQFGQAFNTINSAPLAVGNTGLGAVPAPLNGQFNRFGTVSSYVGNTALGAVPAVLNGRLNQFGTVPSYVENTALGPNPVSLNGRFNGFNTVPSYVGNTPGLGPNPALLNGRFNRFDIAPSYVRGTALGANPLPLNGRFNRFDITLPAVDSFGVAPGTLPLNSPLNTASFNPLSVGSSVGVTTPFLLNNRLNGIDLTISSGRRNLGLPAFLPPFLAQLNGGFNQFNFASAPVRSRSLRPIAVAPGQPCPQEGQGVI